jgi:hypothetical protein
MKDFISLFLTSLLSSFYDAAILQSSNPYPTLTTNPMNLGGHEL